MNDLPLVSISCITFNHARYLRECFDGFLMQQTNFAFEVVIHDDASTDETKAIIEEYTQKHPTIFYPMYQTENQYSKGVRGIMAKFNFPRCRGKYIALCEGDDYWTDPSKLQKQVDFLEANEDYAICAHAVEEKNEITNDSHVFPDIKESKTLKIEHYLLHNYTGTCSILFYSEFYKTTPSWMQKVSFGDLAMVLTILYRSQKKLMVLKDVMGVYRVNEGGVHGSLKKNNTSLIKAYKMHIDFITVVYRDLFHKKEYSKEVKLKLIDTYKKLSDLSKDNDKIQFIYFYFKYFWFRVLLKLEKNIKR